MMGRLSVCNTVLAPETRQDTHTVILLSRTEDACIAVSIVPPISSGSCIIATRILTKSLWLLKVFN